MINILILIQGDTLSSSLIYNARPGGSNSLNLELLLSNTVSKARLSSFHSEALDGVVTGQRIKCELILCLKLGRANSYSLPQSESV